MPFDVIVFGAGVVGSALAYALGKDGKKVLVVERDLREPDRIVGELMQPGGVQKLQELGLGHCLQGIDSPEVHGYAIFIDGKGVKLPYPKDNNGDLQIGQSFHHGKFIMALRNSLASVSNVEVRQGTVTDLLEEGAQVVGVKYFEVVDNDNKKKVYHEERAPLTIVCDGCNSNMRSRFTRDRPVATSAFVGVIIEGTELPLPNHGHVFLCNPGPILAYQIGTNEARMLVDTPLPLPKDLKGYLLTTTAPQLPESIRGAFITAVQTQTPRSMPSSRLHPHDGNRVQPGVLLIGDAFNMRHPLTGGGMSVGLSDAVIVRDILKKVGDLSDTARVSKALKELYTIRKPLASTVNILAGALYNVFAAANDPMLPAMRRACITYFGDGTGIGASGPVSLLSALNPRPLSLVFHFFAVAFVGIAQTLSPFPTPSKILKAYRLLAAAAQIVVPLIKGEGVLRFVPFLCRILGLTSRNSNNTAPVAEYPENY